MVALIWTLTRVGGMFLVVTDRRVPAAKQEKKEEHKKARSEGSDCFEEVDGPWKKGRSSPFQHSGLDLFLLEFPTIVLLNLLGFVFAFPSIILPLYFRCVQVDIFVAVTSVSQLTSVVNKWGSWAQEEESEGSAWW
mgnify:CR=1 FL=1